MNAPIPQSLARDATLEDKYDLIEGWAFMSGTQALVRLAFQQRMRDEAAGLNTAGFISGYRGSPLGRYDLELWRNEKRMKAHHIHFQPGVNEDLAATAVWGSQQVGLFPGARYDGVFAFWYGKTPGVDRSADALRHANAAGTSPRGGVLALCGDDHGAKSSTQAGQSDYILMATGIPVLYPANVQDILDFGLHGIALSRYSGCWAALKLVTDVVESSASVWLSPHAPDIVIPPFDGPEGGLSIRAVDPPLHQEERLYQHKLRAVLQYVRANQLNRIVLDPPGARIGIVTAGKAYADTRQALRYLQIGGQPAECAVRLLKLAMVWPLDPEIITRFARDLDTIVVIEEKRPVIETQLKTILYDELPDRRIRIVGKFDGAGEWSSPRVARLAFPPSGELSPHRIAEVLQAVVAKECVQVPVPGVVAGAGATGRAGEDTGSGSLAVTETRRLVAQEREAGTSSMTPGSTSTSVPVRMPSFCSGCPHNRSTKVPQGSRALAGIGCHGIAMYQQPGVTGTMSHMGGEGVMWVGQAPFTDEKHVFANLGDGTYFHSGFLAIRQAVAARVPITYKLLVNGFVSMTGGQPIDGNLSVPQMAAQLVAEGVGRIVIVADDPGRYAGVRLPDGVRVAPRQELDQVQRELREYPLVSVIIYEQMCATERRRLRKRGKLEDPDRRVFIHPEVCEGCGDCTDKSNCMSVEPVDTETGRKRRINQSSCNKDFSCVEGFCPSFVTVQGGKPRRGATRDAAGCAPESLPEPQLPALGEQPYGILIAGVGGTGVVTVGAVLAMAAHLDGKAVTTLDVTGLAQKYGAVMSHIRLAARADQLQTARLDTGEANVLIGCDLLVSAGDEAIARLLPRASRVAVNSQLTPTSDFLRNPDWYVDADRLLDRLSERVADAASLCALPASRQAEEALGDAIGANMLLLGAAWQRGWIPLSRQSIDRAIELNAVSVELNRKAFELGRRLALAESEAVLRPAAPVVQFVPARLERLHDIMTDRIRRLTDYQNRAYAARYQRLVERVAAAEKALNSERLAVVVARNYYKLLAHKDEFEVARLYSLPEFKAQLQQTFEGDYRLRFHLGGGPFAGRDPGTGAPRKREVGPWVLPVFRMLAAMRRVRGTVLDPFRYSEERQLARELVETYEQDIDRILAGLESDRHELAIAIAAWPEQVRGYGHVRAASAERVAAARAAWWERWESAAAPMQRHVA